MLPTLTLISNSFHYILIGCKSFIRYLVLDSLLRRDSLVWLMYLSLVIWLIKHWSFELMKLLLSLGMKFDVVAQMLCCTCMVICLFCFVCLQMMEAYSNQHLSSKKFCLASSSDFHNVLWYLVNIWSNLRAKVSKQFNSILESFAWWHCLRSFLADSYTCPYMGHSS